MILIITQKSDIHADFVISQLHRIGARFLRFNAEDFPDKASLIVNASNEEMDGTLELYGLHSAKLSEITACWYRHTSWYGQSALFGVSKNLKNMQAIEFAVGEKKAFLNSLWTYLADRFWINYPPNVISAEGKLTNLKIAAELGLEIPKTIITTDPEKVKDFYYTCNGKVINKVLGTTTIKRDNKYYVVYSNLVTKDDLKHSGSVIYTPTQFQEYIPKKIELRVTIVGSKVFACEIHSQNSEIAKIDWRHYDFPNVKHIIHQLPEGIVQKLKKMLGKLNLNYGAFDLILTPDGRYVFLELNPNGQYLWIENLTKMPISRAIAEMLVAGKDI